MKLLVIQNHHLAPLGVLGDCIAKRDIPMDIVTPFTGDPIPVYAYPYSGLILLGGAMNAEDDEHYPYLRDVVRLVQLFSAERKPILGVCLGAQIIARAFRQKVHQHSSLLELGFTPLRFIDQAIAHDPLLQKIQNKYSDSIHLMQWHFDTFDLPAEATLLMTSDRCQNQVYRIHDTIYGFQCHLEVNQIILQDWSSIAKEHLQQHPDFPEQLTQQNQAHLSQSEAFVMMYVMLDVCHAWLDLVELRVYSIL